MSEIGSWLKAKMHFDFIGVVFLEQMTDAKVKTAS